MRLKHWVISLVAILLSLFFSGGIQGQVSDVFEPTKFENSTSSILAQSSDSTDTMKFGYLKDAFPVSHEEAGKGIIKGYCGKLKNYLDKNGYKSKEIAIPSDKRFKKYEGITVECSANTITQKRVSELESIAVPPPKKSENESLNILAKIIIRNDSHDHLKDVTSEFRIGLMSNTITESIARNIYPKAKVVTFDNRANAIKGLKLSLKDDKAINAFISDETLLPTILRDLTLNLYSYEEIIFESSDNKTTLKVSDLKSLEVPTLPKSGNEFSEPFFQTGAKIIIRNGSRSHLDKVTSEFRIGVMSNTTTESIGSSIYPNATVVKVDDRANAINRLQLTLTDEKAIDAFISDEILLSTILSELPSNSYSIEPKAYGFSNESYGVVVYGNPDLLKVINKWIKSKDGEEARKNELDSKALYNPISQGLSFLLSQDYFYNLVGFLLVFLPLLFLLLILTHPLFITLIAKFPLFTKFVSWMRRRELRGKTSFVDHLIIRILHDEAFNVIICKANNSLFPMFIDRETVVSVIKEVGQPFLHFNNGNEPSTVDVEKVAQNFAQQAESNPHFTKVLETLKDAATEETDKWIRNAVTRAFELLKQTIDPSNGTS